MFWFIIIIIIVLWENVFDDHCKMLCENSLCYGFGLSIAKPYSAFK